MGVSHPVPPLYLRLITGFGTLWDKNGTTVSVSRFGTVPGLFEVPDSPTASFVGIGDGFFFRDGYVLLEWWHPPAVASTFPPLVLIFRGRCGRFRW